MGWDPAERNVFAGGSVFWKKMSEVKGGKAESCSRIKDRNGRLALVENEMRRIILRTFIFGYPGAGFSPHV